MDMRLLEVYPNELKFTFQAKKQESCTIQLKNNTFDHVAFKVKTTNFKKYCVRPNMGIIKPLSSCLVTFTMQAQSVAPLDMVCKDKFLIQSTVVPTETTVDDITSTTMFGKSGSKNIEETKLNTIIVIPNVEPLRKEVAIEVLDQSNDEQMEELKLKITKLEVKLHEAMVAISKLEQERPSNLKAKSFKNNCSIL
ncbi:vesicle-associated protein 2-2-like [Cucurbita moschata]|uniref:Vesicle-associated protein 2-2-like n=1 Tax=Cucurbita moschata TaxID=3662 RepID=A0A6J1HCB9_CUCMO|nr:vesicle-associated protein 2-2-like [Cucurbita moschata]